MGHARGPAEFAREQGVRAGEDAEHACEGVLAFDAEGGPRLRLTAASAAAFPDLDDDRFTVHGLDEQGAAYTLLEAVLVSSEGQLFSGIRDVEIVGFLLIRGTHVLAVADLAFDHAVLAISGLVDLLGQPPAPELESFPPRLADGPIQRVVPVPGAVLTLRSGDVASGQSPHQECPATIDVQLEAATSWDQLRDDWLPALTNLVLFATRGAGRLEAISTSGTLRDGPRFDSVDLVWRHSGLRLDREPKAERMLLTLRAVGDQLNDIVRAWVELHKELGRAATFLFGALDSRMYLENRLIGLMSAGEAFHRTRHDDPPVSPEEHARLTEAMLATVADPALREHYRDRLLHADELSQRRRIRWLVNRAAEILPRLAQRPGRRVDQLVSTRNAFVHLPTDAGEILRGEDLLRETNILVLVLETNLLLELRLPPGTVAGLVRHAYQQDLLLRELVRPEDR